MSLLESTTSRRSSPFFLRHTVTVAAERQPTAGELIEPLSLDLVTRSSTCRTYAQETWQPGAGVGGGTTVGAGVVGVAVGAGGWVVGGAVVGGCVDGGVVVGGAVVGGVVGSPVGVGSQTSPKPSPSESSWPGLNVLGQLSS